MELVLTEFGTFLGKSGKRLVVKRPDNEPVEVPAEDVTNILIASNGISVSSDAVYLATKHGATITFLAFSGEPFAKVIPPESFGRAELRKQQLLAANDQRGVTLAKAFLQGKLRNQAANLRYFAKSRKDTAPSAHGELHALADGIETILEELLALAGDNLDTLRTQLMNREARAAQAYWRGVALLLPDDVAFPGRVRRGATDLFNVSLNYGYGILYSRLWSVLMAVGLDPYAGYLHVYEENKPTLVFDFIEEFRQLTVDRPVLAAFVKRWRPGFDEDGHLDRRSRRDLAARALDRLNGRVDYEGKSVRLVDVVKSEAYEVVETLRGGPAHRPYIADW